MATMDKYFLIFLKALLFLTVLTPLIVAPGTIAPYVFMKAVYYRVLVEITLAAFAFYLVWKFFASREKVLSDFTEKLKKFKNPFFIFILLFFVSAGLSSLLAPNSYRAFFGDLDRSEGYFGVLHYFVFLVLALVIFSKKNWLWFFKISMFVALITMFYDWLQVFGVKNFPFALEPGPQPGSFTGNPAYLASYMVISFGLAVYVFLTSPRRSFYRFFSVLYSVLALITVSFTSIRGALVGIALGLLFLILYMVFFGRGDQRFFGLKIRTLGAALLGLAVVFSVVFWNTRQADFWYRIPGINRIARADFSSASIATRLLGWKTSLVAWQDRPILGWGMENYNVAYNKHFDPTYSFYAEDWFDRAHNRLIDVLVMQGIFGLIVYLGMFGALFYVIFSRRYHNEVQGETAVRAAPFIGAVIVAYFVQNLFIFDQIISYILFFAIAGFIIAESDQTKLANDHKTEPIKLSKGTSKLILPASALVLAAASLYALYFYNFIPGVQAFAYRDALRPKPGSRLTGEKVLMSSDKFLLPYTFAQAGIRSLFLEYLYNQQVIANRSFDPLVLKALAALEETADKEPFEPRFYTRLIESYNERAKDDPSLYPKIYEFAQKAVKLTPLRQGPRFHLAFALSALGRHDEAIKMARETVALEPRAAKSYYQLAIILALAADVPENKDTPLQKKYREEAEKSMDEARRYAIKKTGTLQDFEKPDDPLVFHSTQYNFFLESDIKNIVALYKVWGKYDKLAEAYGILINVFNPKKTEYYYQIIDAYRQTRNADGIIKYAEKLKEVDPSVADDMDVIIDLAKKKNWQILDTL